MGVMQSLDTSTSRAPAEVSDEVQAHPRPDLVVPLSVVVLTWNEELNLPDCLASVAGWTGEIWVVDSGSTDRTVAIAEAFGARLVIHAFQGHARQWNWALGAVPFRYDWVLCLDADHRVTAELRADFTNLFGLAPRDATPAQIRSAASAKLDEFDGFYVRRKQIFRGKWIRYGAYYPRHLLKLVRVQAAWSDERELTDHRLYVKGRSGHFRGDLIEDNRNEADITVWIQKHLVYAERQAREELLRRREKLGWSIRPTPFGTPDQRTLWLKSWFYRMPVFVRPFGYLIYRYVLRLGFLDGKEGFIFHFLQAFWYRLMVDIFLQDLERQSKPSEAADFARAARGSEPRPGANS